MSTSGDGDHDVPRRWRTRRRRSVGGGVGRPAAGSGGARKVPGLDVALREWLRENDDER
jgi:hypothetical protein